MNEYADYYWTITRDLICEPNLDGEKPAVGTSGPGNADESLRTNPARFSLYDDDGELYYCGMIYGDYDGFEPLDDFGSPNAGCTSIKINGEWL